MNNKIYVIDYGYGNIHSIVSALKILGYEVKISNKPNEIKSAKMIILPGVGAFGQAMNSLKRLGLDDAIKEAILNQSFLLGICLGYQMLFDESEEFGRYDGLKFVKGKVVKLSDISIYNRIPNVGWRPLILKNKSDGIPKSFNNKMVYFVHSYVPIVDDIKKVSSYINFGDHQIHASVHSNQIIGFQFHPEKSGKIGLKILDNSLKLLNNP